MASQSSLASAQQSPPSKADADALFAAQDFAGAVTAYEAIASQLPNDGQLWFNLGYARHFMKNYRSAIEGHARANQLSFRPDLARYNLACAYALLGETDNAFKWLDSSMDAGFNRPPTLASDTDLNSLRSDARFADAIARTNANASAPRPNPAYRQFDFWLGEWDVFDPNGKKQGTNVITSISNGFGILEVWTSTSGNIGTSISYFNATSGQWIQVWVNQGGQNKTGTGSFSNGTMRLLGNSNLTNGNTILGRTTWTPMIDGRVRQLIEQTTDGGSTWNSTFDGIYVKRK